MNRVSKILFCLLATSVVACGSTTDPVSGEDGKDGKQGPAGVPGSVGPEGPQGPAGIGTPGSNGVPGSAGPQGVPGSTGAPGSQGPQGNPGAGVAACESDSNCGQDFRCADNGQCVALPEESDSGVGGAGGQGGGGGEEPDAAITPDVGETDAQVEEPDAALPEVDAAQPEPQCRNDEACPANQRCNDAGNCVVLTCTNLDACDDSQVAGHECHHRPQPGCCLGVYDDQPCRLPCGNDSDCDPGKECRRFVDGVRYCILEGAPDETIAGCNINAVEDESNSCEECLDRDGDGLCSPQEVEVCDGFDNTGDGRVDEGQVCRPVPVDADHDGSVAGVDCDDANSNVHPGAVEVCNLLDDNCDGNVNENLYCPVDADGDGYFGNDRDLTMRDCDDSDSATNPGIIEGDTGLLCNDGVDQDCDDADTVCAPEDTGTTVTVECLCGDTSGNGQIDNGEISCAAFNGCEVHLFHWSERPGDTDSFGVSLEAGGGYSIHLSSMELCGWGGFEVKTRVLNEDGIATSWYGDDGAPEMDRTVEVSLDQTVIHDPFDLNPRLRRQVSLSTNDEGNFVYMCN